MKRAHAGIWKSVVLVLLAAANGWAQQPNGSELQVNTYTAGNQWRSGVAVDGSGHFVVSWSGSRSGTEAVLARRFTSAGVPRGAEFLVNTYTTGGRDYPAIASDRAGNFVVTWDSYGQDGHQYGVFGRRFDATGASVGGEFQVNTYTTGWQYSSSVAMDGVGNFVVVWQDPMGQDGSGIGVFGRRYDASAGSFGPQFRVNTFTTGSQRNAAVAAAADGNFVVVWNGAGPGDGSGVFARRYDPQGLPRGGEFLVNSVTANAQFFASVASAPDGAFVVVWQDYVLDGSNNGIFGRRYDAGGNPVGAQFLVNSYTTGEQIQPKVAIDRTGAFVVTWWNYSAPGDSSFSVRARSFDAAGVAVGDEVRVNTYTTGLQAHPVVATGPAGHFVVVWQSSPQDGNSYGVFGQRFGDLIFADSFASASP
jgi:hypothetical protein